MVKRSIIVKHDARCRDTTMYEKSIR